MKEENTQEEPKQRIKKVRKTRHQTHRGDDEKNNIVQAFIIIIAFVLIGYIGFNLLFYLLEIVF